MMKLINNTVTCSTEAQNIFISIVRLQSKGHRVCLFVCLFVSLSKNALHLKIADLNQTYLLCYEDITCCTNADGVKSRGR
jgi:hypothetical protein